MTSKRTINRKAFIHRTTWMLILVFLGMIYSSRTFAQLPDQFQRVELVSGLTNAISMEFSPDGRIFLVDRYGDLLFYDLASGTLKNAGSIDVFTEVEDGLLDVAFDPNFLSNNFIYIHYSATDKSVNRISRFTMNGNSMVMSSEVIMLEIPVERVGAFHAGGDMEFDSQGNLYIATGDNTDHGKWFAGNEDQEYKSAEKSSSNTNDLRGKILRITPQPDGTYTIPGGNLFPNGSGGLPEIYVMGARNPFKIFVDSEKTDWLFWGEVGPDANAASTEGPVGLDEINLTKAAGNYGWPNFSGKNSAYLSTYSSPQFYYNPAAPVNLSKWNTGAVNLPPAQESWLEFFHQCYLAGPRYYYNPDLTDSKRLPIEYDEVFFYFDFNTSQIWAVQMDEDGNILSNEQVSPSVFPSSEDGFIDLEIGPDGHLYILEYGEGCCKSNVGTGILTRIDYIGIISNSSPVVTISATPDNGGVPLDVTFSSDGTYDPDGDNLLFEWDFQTDGTVDSTDPNPTFTYTGSGIFNAQVKVSDGKGGVVTKNLTINAGNSSPVFTVSSVPDGGFINWGDDINFDITVDDAEDGSTTNGGIDCADVNIVPALGHLTHFHDGLTINDCSGSITVATDHDIQGQDDIFFVLGMNYTDEGGLTAFDQIVIHPKRKEAEFYNEESNTTLIPNNDQWTGGVSSLRVNNDSYIMYEGRNLQNIFAVRYRVTSVHSGGKIELRMDSPNGPLLSTATVPNTGGFDQWTTVGTTLSDPGGKHDLYVVFKNSTQNVDIMDINWVEFEGPGAGIDNSPPDIENAAILDENTIRLVFDELLNIPTAENLSNYALDKGINITGVELQPDERTVYLTTSTIASGVNYTLTITGVKNIAGLSIANNTHNLILTGPNLINAGGPEITFADGSTFDADRNFTGGKTFNKPLAILNTNRTELYQTERFGDMSYQIPVEYPGYYDIVLHFAELYYGIGSNPGGPGSRVFDVTIEGVKVLDDFDILAETDPATALVKQFPQINITDGFLSINFVGEVENAKISGIEILEGGTIDQDPSIDITSPANNAAVTQPFNISFDAQNWAIQEGGDHVHVFVDGEHILSHYSTNPIEISNLSPGLHNIRLELYRAGHTASGYSDQINVNVQNGTTCIDKEMPLDWEPYDVAGLLPSRPYQQIAKYDLDGDEYPDIAMGKWWYKNPGVVGSAWQINNLSDIDQVFYAHDFDGDGDIDLLGTGTDPLEFIWLENDGNGNFTSHFNIESGIATNTDFLSDFTGGVFNPGGPYQIALTYNKGELGYSGVNMITVPNDPINSTWQVEEIHPTSEGEGIASGDIDGDGDLDIFQGFHWLRNNGNSWQLFNTGLTFASHLDRVDLADLDNDGDLDGIAGQIGSNKELVWMEVGDDPTKPWTKYTIDPDIDGTLSLSLSDMDKDGDIDILMGEWRNNNNAIIFENDLCNSGTWIKNVISSGLIDHHNGMHLSDVDQDGDDDIVTMGWFTYQAKILINNKQPTNGGGGDDEDWALRINAGGGTINTGGKTWTADQYSLNGKIFNRDMEIAGTNDDPLFTTERFNKNAPLQYSIPVPSEGFYTVNLLFAEIWFGAPGGGEGGEGSRVFNISVEGQQLNNYDIVAAAGGSATAVVQTFSNVSVADGVLNITLQNVTENPKISAIEIIRTSGDSGGNTQPPQVTATNELILLSLPDNDTTISVTAVDPDGSTSLIYEWLQMSGPSTATLSGTDTEALLVDDLQEGTYVFEVTVTDDDGEFTKATIQIIVSNPANWAMRINSGGPELTHNGDTWEADNYFVGGKDWKKLGLAIANTTNDALYQTERYGKQGAVVYEIPVPQVGSYEVILHFAEIYFGLPGGGSAGGVGSRTFHIDVEGSRIESNYDIFQEANGAAKAITVVASAVGVSDGVLNITLLNVNQNAKLSGIEVILGGLEDAPPIADAGEDQTISVSGTTVNGSGFDPDGGNIVSYSWAQTNGPSDASITEPTNATTTINGLEPGTYTFTLTVTDDEGQTGSDDIVINVSVAGTWSMHINSGGNVLTDGSTQWMADNYFDGGKTYFKDINIAGTSFEELYKTERFFKNGPLVYNIPVPASGDYDVMLHFAELFFGLPGWGESGGIGSRTFHIDIEGTRVESNYDIFKEAGGPATAVVETYIGINVTDGFLTIVITGTKNNGKVNGISVMDSNGGAILPLANAGQDQSITSQATTIEGSGSDPDGGAVSFQWTQEDGPNDADMADANTSTLLISNLVEGTYTFKLTVTDDENQTASDLVDITVGPASNNTWATRINAGGSAESYDGNDWIADAHFQNGKTFTKNVNVTNTDFDAMYQSERFSKSGSLVYNIPVPSSGDYEVFLHFSEMFFGMPGRGSDGGVGSRVFNILIEGNSVASNYDIFEQAGGAGLAIIESFTGINVTDGAITIELVGVTENPKVNGIEIYSANTLPANNDFDEELLGGESTQIYPNPFNDSFNIVAKDGDSIKAVYVYDLTGTLILDQQNIDKNSINIKLSQQSNGVYVVDVYTSSGLERYRVVKN